MQTDLPIFLFTIITASSTHSKITSSKLSPDGGLHFDHHQILYMYCTQ